MGITEPQVSNKDTALEVENNKPKEQEEATSTTVSKASAIILVIAIGAHAFFEGIAFGLQTSVESAF